MSDILLVRHAETDLKGTFCGQSDPPLHEKALPQLQILLQMLAPYQIASIYSSDLLRARSTAQTIADRYMLEIASTSNLREIHFGAWEGLAWDEIERRDPLYVRCWMDGFPYVPAPGGEAYEVFRRRVLQAFDAIHATASSGTIVIVSHAGVMQLLLTARWGWSEERAYEKTRRYACVIPLQRTEMLA